mgnify:CR=1 FL=1
MCCFCMSVSQSVTKLVDHRLKLRLFFCIVGLVWVQYHHHHHSGDNVIFFFFFFFTVSGVYIHTGSIFSFLPSSLSFRVTHTHTQTHRSKYCLSGNGSINSWPEKKINEQQQKEA